VPESRVKSSVDSLGVTHTEFESHQRHVDQRLQNLDDAMQRGFSVLGNQFSSLSDKLDRQTRPNYNLLIGFVTIGLTLASFAGALVYTSNSNVDALSKARDTAILDQLDSFRSGSNRWSYSQHTDYAKDTQSKLDRHTNRIESNVKDLTELSGEVKSIKSELATWVGELNRRGVSIDNNTELVSRIEERVKALGDRVDDLEAGK